MKISFVILVILFFQSAILAATTSSNFDNDTTGAAPKDFTAALTGKGKAGMWVVMADASAPSKPNVLAQTDADSTSYRFPLCIFEGTSAKDVDITVKFKPISGKVDQAAGIVWRYKDANNYYIVRANALEGNVVMYKVQNGKRSDLKPRGAGIFAYGVKSAVPSGQWSSLCIVAKGNLFEIYLNDKKLFDLEDSTFPEAGKVGLWTSRFTNAF